MTEYSERLRPQGRPPTDIQPATTSPSQGQARGARLPDQVDGLVLVEDPIARPLLVQELQEEGGAGEAGTPRLPPTECSELLASAPSHHLAISTH